MFITTFNHGSRTGADVDADPSDDGLWGGGVSVRCRGETRQPGDEPQFLIDSIVSHARLPPPNSAEEGEFELESFE